MHDIALIRLKESVVFTEFIKPICLPTAPHLKDKIFDGLLLTLAGFGRTENGTSSDFKLKLDVPAVNWNRCHMKYEALSISLGDNEICAGGVTGKDSCDGDSGKRNQIWISFVLLEIEK